jgi:hypothetical protein
MYVLVQKVNDGVTFYPCNKAGVPKKLPRPKPTFRGKSKPAEIGPTTRLALDAAEEWYRAEVMAAFDSGPMKGCGYADDFRQHAYTKDGEGGRFLKLEPVGFAIVGDDGQVTMNDSGSTPTTGRAKVLACYQAPLLKVKSTEGEGWWRFERIVTTEPAEVPIRGLDKMRKIHRVIPPVPARATCASPEGQRRSAESTDLDRRQ